MGEQQTKSTMCPVVCRWTPSCGRGSARTPGRTPAVSSSNNSKNTASPAALDFCLLGASFAASRVLSVFRARMPSYFAPAATLSKLWWQQRTGPLRRSAAHVATMSADVASFSAMRSRGRHAASCRPPGF